MQNLDFCKYIPRVVEQLSGKGVFLNTKYGDTANTMTIGWGAIGRIWSKPIFTVAVRYSRYTYQLIDKSGEFTVSIPLTDSLDKALAFCGSRSGRDVDKFRECGLTAVSGIKVASPYIGECELHYECKVVYKQAMDPGLILSEGVGKCYPKPDYHVIYYGEILNCFSR